MNINEFIDQYTPTELEKIDRNSVFDRFQNKQAVQNISQSQSQFTVETSPIRSPQRAKSPDKKFRY